MLSKQFQAEFFCTECSIDSFFNYCCVKNQQSGSYQGPTVFTNMTKQMQTSIIAFISSAVVAFPHVFVCIRFLYRRKLLCLCRTQLDECIGYCSVFINILTILPQEYPSDVYNHLIYILVMLSSILYLLNHNISQALHREGNCNLSSCSSPHPTARNC